MRSFDTRLKQGENIMKKNRLIHSVLAIAFLISAVSTPAQRGSGGGIRTDGRMVYHNGPVMQGTTTLYVIWYGNWASDPTTTVLIPHLASALGSSAYFLINTTYPDSSGGAPSGSLTFAGAVSDNYSHGPTLTVEDIQAIVSQKIDSVELPLNTLAIYLVIASSDVTDIQMDGTSFCTPGASPHHGVGIYEGAYFKYGFLGDPRRCPTSAGPQFVAPNGGLLPTPNDNFTTDAMASNLARLVSATVTNPIGTAWYDKYGLENSDKCVGQFGTTYTLPNGARANMRLGGRDWLIQQNWINERKGRCTLSVVD
jgi:hypothetical protein